MDLKSQTIFKKMFNETDKQTEGKSVYKKANCKMNTHKHDNFMYYSKLEYMFMFV